MWLSKWEQKFGSFYRHCGVKSALVLHQFVQKNTQSSCNDTFNNSLLWFWSGRNILHHESLENRAKLIFNSLFRYLQPYLIATKDQRARNKKWINAWWIHDVMVLISNSAWCERLVTLFGEETSQIRLERDGLRHGFRLATQPFFVLIFIFLKKKKNGNSRNSTLAISSTRAGDVRQRIIFFWP